MYINLKIGDKDISIEKDWRDGEGDITWIEVAEELIFPALRAYGYIIDDEFSNSLDELHQEYLSRKYNKSKWTS
jgi:hypothetical protein